MVVAMKYLKYKVKCKASFNNTRGAFELKFMKFSQPESWRVEEEGVREVKRWCSVPLSAVHEKYVISEV